MWRFQYCVWKQRSAKYTGFLNIFVYLCRSVWTYILHIYTPSSSSWKFRETKNHSSEMLFNGHKPTDLLYLQQSLNGSEKAHQGLLSSFRLFILLFNTVNLYFHIILIFLMGKIPEKHHHQESCRSKRWNRCPLVVLHRNPLVHAPRIYERDIFLLEQLMPMENKNTENVISGSAVDSQNSG